MSTDDEGSEDARQLLRYFERAHHESVDEHMRRGAAVCRRWLDMTASGTTQAAIDDVAAVLDAEASPGSGWIDLGLRFKHWARVRGFSV